MKRIAFIVLPLFFAACALIDDNLSVCGEELLLDYELQFHAELNMQLQTELMTEAEGPVREALSKWLEPIFTDKAKDVDLRFFSTETDELRYHIQEEINAKRTSFTFQLPKENYMHLGVANIADNNQVRLSDANHAATMQLVASEKNELAAFNTGIFTTRTHMEIGDTSQQFDVRLYMATCAVAVVIDTTVCDSLVSIRATLSGSASSFNLRDSLYTYNGKHKLIFENVPIGPPPPMSPARRAQQEKEGRPFTLMATSGFPTADEQAWSITITSELTNNRRTVTTMKVDEPVRAGTLRIIRAHVTGNGGVEPDEGQEVGVSIELDWKNGGHHEIDI